MAARTRLVAAGIHPAEASLDTGLLARDVLGWDRATLLVRELEPPSLDFIDRFAATIDRRAAREPIAYIRGVQEFWSRDFVVSPAVLIPTRSTAVKGIIAFQKLGEEYTSASESSRFRGGRDSTKL